MSGPLAGEENAIRMARFFEHFFSFFLLVNRRNILLVSGPIAVEENAGQVFTFT